MKIETDVKTLDKMFIEVGNMAFHARSNKKRLADVYALIDRKIEQLKKNKRNLSNQGT